MQTTNRKTAVSPNARTFPDSEHPFLSTYEQRQVIEAAITYAWKVFDQIANGQTPNAEALDHAKGMLERAWRLIPRPINPNQEP